MGVLLYGIYDGLPGRDPTLAVTITVPAGARRLTVQCFGGGGGGKYHGGGGGAWAQAVLPAGGITNNVSDIIQPGGQIKLYLGQGGWPFVSFPPTDTYVGIGTFGQIVCCRAACGTDATLSSPGLGGRAGTGVANGGASSFGNVGVKNGGDGGRNRPGILQGAGGGGVGRSVVAGATPTNYMGGALGGGNGGLQFFGGNVSYPTQGQYGGGGGGSEGTQPLGIWNRGGCGRIIYQLEN